MLRHGMATWRTRRKKPTRGHGVDKKSLGPDQTKPQGSVAVMRFRPPRAGWDGLTVTQTLSKGSSGIDAHRKLAGR